MRNFKKLLLIDLDGVLNDYRGNYNKDLIPPMKNGAGEFLGKLSEKFDIKIFTTRDKKLAHDWLETNGLCKYVSGVTNIKEPAYLHIDDRCIRFDGNFKNTVDEIETFNVYWSY